MTDNESKVELEVAGLHYGIGGDWDGMEFPDGWIGDAETTFEERTRVTLLVTPDQTLVSVLDDAADAMGIRAQWESTGKPFVGFWRNSSAHSYGRISSYVPVVDSDGVLVWEPDWHGLPYSAIKHTGELGLLGGDPQKLELVLLPAHGDWHASWADLASYWQAAEPVLDDVLRATGALGLAHGALKTIRKTIRMGREAVDGNFREWNRRHASPHHLAALLESATADEATFARGLGLSVEQFRSLQLVMGFVPDGGDADEREIASALRELRRIGESIAHETPRVGREDVVRSELEKLLATGDAGTASAAFAKWNGLQAEPSMNEGFDPSWMAEEELRTSALAIMQNHMKRKPKDAEFALKVYAILRS